MFKKFLFLFAVMFISANLMAQTWTEQTSPITTALTCVSVVNDNVAWACGDGGKVLRTINAGVNWTDVSGTISTAYALENIFAWDANTALTTGYLGSNTVIYQTSNGGTNWTLAFGPSAGFGDDLWMTDANTAYFIGDPVGGFWDLKKSTNAGSSWVTWATIATTNTVGTYVNAACFLGQQVWYPSPAQSTMQYTSNMGVNWGTLSTSLASVTATYFINSTTGLCGGYSSSPGLIRTTNGGTSWTTVAQSFIGASTVMGLTGRDSEWWVATETTTPSAIYYSSNDGANWASQYPSPAGTFYHISKARTGNTIWAVRSNGGIARCTLPPPPPTGTWTEQISPVTTELNSVSAVDDDVAWASGAAGKVVRTTNKGVLWSNVSGDLPTANPAYVIWAFDANNAVVTTSPATTTGARIFKTTNGGTTWVQTFYQSNGWGDGLYFMNATTGFFYGDHAGTRLSIFKTTDGGTTWDSTGMNFTTTSDGWNNAMFGLGNQIWIGTNSTTVVYSSNAGVNWIGQTVSAANTYGFWFNSPTNGLAGGASNVFKSTNSGTNWATITSPFANNATGICGAGTSYWLTTFEPRVFHTANDGATYDTAYIAPGTGQFRHITKARNGSTIWGVRTTGEISRYGSILVGVTPISEITPIDYKLSQNYPNPFNPTTKISFALPKSGFVSLKVYDILGKEVATLVNSNMSVGSYLFEFNASNLTSGIYFYRLESNGFIDTKKMMLIK